MRGSKLVIDFLVDRGCDTFFLITGGAIVPTVDYLGEKKDIRYFCFQHEQSAGMAAEAYFRVTGKIPVVLVTSGPGAQNLLNAVCGCWFESIPCVFITGQVSTYESCDSLCSENLPRQVGFQETSVVNIFREFTKYCSKVFKKVELLPSLKEGYFKMLEGRYGPILIDLPVDIQTSEILETSFTDTSLKKEKAPDLDLDQFKKLFKDSKNPLILIGNGVRLSNAIPEVKNFIEKYKIPFVVSWGGFDLLPHDHPQFVGDIGVYGKRSANFVVQNCDLLLVLGSRLDTRQTGGTPSSFARSAKKIVVDIDEGEIFKDRGITVDVPIVSDIKLFLQQVSEFTLSSSLENRWVSWIRERKSLNYDPRSSKDKLDSYVFLDTLNEVLPQDGIIIPDEGGNLIWSMQSIKVKGEQRIFSNFGNSSMGYALPASIGASIGSNRPIICIDGDGGFQMNLQELQTVVHYNLPIKIFILNNNCYGIIKQFQDSYFGGRYTATEGKDYSAPNFSEIAKAYGLKTEVLDIKSDISSKLQDILNYDGPVLCEVLIDKDQKLIPKLEFGRPLEDMSPYLSEEDLHSNMMVPCLERLSPDQGWVDLK